MHRLKSKLRRRGVHAAFGDSTVLHKQKSPSFPDTVSDLRNVLEACTKLSGAVEHAGEAIVDSLSNGGTMFTCGNGGSAADALHLAEELTGKFRRMRRALPAICLNADVAALTCIANDFGYDRVFARQVEGLACPGDAIVGFTTSGNSPNICRAFQTANEQGLITILLSGKDGGEARKFSRHAIIVPSHSTARIQEVHTLILHQWLEVIDAHPWP